MSSMSCVLPSNPDVAGVGVRSAIYVQSFLSFILPFSSLWDGEISVAELQSANAHSTTNLILAFTILFSAFLQAVTRGLSNYHTSIILNLSWMNNTNAFIYFVLFVHYGSQDPSGYMGRWNLINLVVRMLGRMWIWIVLIFHGEFRGSLSILTGGQTVHQKAAGDQPSALMILILGSLHFTLMSSLGIWLWMDPSTFGTSDSASCIVEAAHLSIIGAQVPFKSEHLQYNSLIIYSAFLIPFLNLLCPAMLYLSFHWWYYRSGSGIIPAMAWQRLEHNKSSDDKASNELKNLSPDSRHARQVNCVPPRPFTELSWAERIRVIFPALAGLSFLLVTNIVLIADIELTLQRNKHLQRDGDESEWGFGQTLAILVAVIPTLRDFMGAISRWQRERQEFAPRHLLDAINRNDANQVARWVKRGGDPNFPADNDRTPLEVACFARDKRLVRLLTLLGVDASRHFSDGQIPLHVACKENWHFAVLPFLEHGAKLNDQDNLGNTALHIACESGFPQCVQKLLADYEDKSRSEAIKNFIALQNNKGKTALQIAQDLECTLKKENALAEKIEDSHRIVKLLQKVRATGMEGMKGENVVKGEDAVILADTLEDLEQGIGNFPPLTSV